MAVENPSLVVHPHALVGDGRVAVVEAFLPGETLGAYIKRTGVIVPAGPVAVWHNGYRVPDALWRRLIPRQGDQVVIRARVLGGGGGGKILRTVAMIALVVVAAATQQWYLANGAGMLGMSAATTASMLGAGIMIGGTLLINALLPPPMPTAAQLGTGQKYESSPTYAISGGRNRMRPWEPMTLVFGRHKLVPDMGAKYWTEYVGDDQYLNQVFHLGLQNWDVNFSDIRIGDTPYTNYQGVQLQAADQNGRLSMFPGNVDTLQGFLLSSSAGWVERNTPINTNHISIELASSLFYISDDGQIVGRLVEAEIQYRPVSGGAWTTIGQASADGGYASHYWSLRWRAESLGPDGYDGGQLEYGTSNPTDHFDGEFVHLGGPTYGVWRWLPHPYTLGQPWYGIAPDPRISQSGYPVVRIQAAKQEPTRLTVRWDVPQGQYAVRVRKWTADVKNSRESNETAVGQILCYQSDSADYTNQLRMALRIKASGQLNGVVDEFNLIVEAFCQVWNGSSWVHAHTRNPAWWFLWFARGKFGSSGDRLYGAGLTDSQIDIEAIKAWGAWCTAKGLTFDYVLDRKISSAEMLQIIARAGRASPTWQTGKLGVVWDAADQPVVAMFGPFNIRAGSFKVDYINDDTADEIILNFVNKKTWAMDEVRVRVPGATTTSNPLQLDFDGCTEAAMAGKEANLLAASQVWHRRRVSWETDIEGWVAGRGDVVQISHDLTVWGYSGRVLARAGNVITLDRTIPSDGAGTMMIRGPENQMKVVSVTSGVGDVDALTITSDMTGFPLPGDSGYEDCANVDWAWFFDPLATPGRRFKITSVQPSEDGVKFQAVDDDPEYYASENDPYQYTPPRDGVLLAGVVLSLSFNETIVDVRADITNVSIGWSLSVSMPVDVVESINGTAQPVTRTQERSITVQAQTGDVISVTVTPVPTSGRGTPRTQKYTVQGLTTPLPAVTGLTNVFRDGLTTLVWDRVVDIRQPEYEMRVGPTWINARTVAVTPSLEALAVENGLYWVAARFAYRGSVVYGPADSLQISGATLVRNVLAVTDEHPDWNGEVGGGAFIHDSQLTLAGAGDILDAEDVLALDDVLWYGGATVSGTYETDDSNIIDIGFPTPVRVDFSISEYAFNFHENVLALPDVFEVADILNESNRQHYKVQPQIRHAGDDAVWSEWRDYVPGLINARYFDVRLVLETDDAMIVPFVTAFTWTIDVPDMIQRAEQITIPAPGLRITYPKQFHATPNVQIATFDAVSGDRYVLTNSDETGFDIRLYNGATAVQRQINWISQGY